MAIFITAGAEQEAITEAVLQASAQAKDDEFRTREEIGWHLLHALREGRLDGSAVYTAFTLLFKRQVIGCLRRFGISSQDAEEMNREVARRVLEQQANLRRESGKLGGYVSTTARNLGIDHCQREKPQSVIATLEQSSTTDAETNRLRQAQAKAWWSNVVSLLPPHQAITVLLLEYLQYRPREVVTRWSSTHLDDIASWIERECRDIEQRADPIFVTRCFETLRGRLALPVAKTSDKGERTRLQAIWDLAAGSVVLAAYCETNAADNFSQWNSRSKSRIRIAKLREHPELFLAEG